ncbi:hypothetical protein HNR06_000703 [Nocardiopsis arvandica]|uniref:Uncharacterized protein n=1 Tax=Nocardiopsis sinuspersici TaxID=501010 RepID=A0A7Y9X8I0_9ACTN|nr:hypothetical protein [Nocardiopsis sinuspersici]NYH51114.1 hypothetical protein [Nocardiopsis sinuspersici]
MDPVDLLPYAMGVFFNGICVLSASDIVLRAWRGEGRHRFPDRWDALARLAGTLLYLLIALLMTSWAVFPVAVWYLVSALTAAAAAGVVLRWPELPARAEDRSAATRRVSAVGTLVFLAVAVTALLVLGVFG